MARPPSRSKEDLDFQFPRDGLSLEAIDDFYHRLAAAVIVSAVRDALGGSAEKEKHKQEAISWLLDPENEDTWFLLAGVTRRHVLSWIQAGCKTDRLPIVGSGHQHRALYREYELKKEPRKKAPPADPDMGPEF
jgi:hypothetical protein